MNTDRDQRSDRGTGGATTVAAGPAKGAFDLVVATAAYAVLTIALTWPLARGLTRDVPGDFGDPLFTAWAISWDATHLGRGLWSANIFAPHPLALAYSEHFLPQALQSLPVYAATGNPILCYNLLFLSTFVIAGLGMFLLGRELTGSSAAGFVAGLAFAFAPYRIASIPHLQVLSSQWMPFVLFGFRRHFATGRRAPLAGAAVAWTLQNLSCGYYLLFFSPVVLFYLAWEMTTRGLWRDRRAVMRLVVACGAVGVATVPFLLPYLELRRLGFSPRSLVETRRFSADVHAYFTADPNLRLWGPLAQAWPHAEGLLFPGLTIVVLATLGAARLKGSAWFNAAVICFGCLVVALLLGWSIRLPGIKITSLGRVLAAGGAAAAVLLTVSRSARAAASAALRSPVAFFVLMALFAIAMSFGPDIRARGRLVSEVGIYGFFYDFVPGFDGVRVPARYATIATLALASLAAFGAASIDAGGRRRKAVIAAGALIVVEAIAVPIPINQNSTEYAQTGLAPLPAKVETGTRVAPVYGFLAELPGSAVVLELPLGEPAFDVRYMFYSTNHWKRLVNGYSGGAPQDYGFLTEALKDAELRPDRAWQAVAGSAATHVVVHEAFFTNGRGRWISDWIAGHGAAEVAAFETDRVFSLPSR